MSEIKGDQQLEHIIATVNILELLEYCRDLAVRIRHVFEDQYWGVARLVHGQVMQSNDIWASIQDLQYLDFSQDFELAYRLQDLDADFLIVLNMDPAEYF
jgi:hypothetical protein